MVHCELNFSLFESFSTRNILFSPYFLWGKITDGKNSPSGKSANRLLDSSIESFTAAALNSNELAEIIAGTEKSREPLKRCLLNFPLYESLMRRNQIKIFVCVPIRKLSRHIFDVLLRRNHAICFFISNLFAREMRCSGKKIF